MEDNVTLQGDVESVDKLSEEYANVTLQGDVESVDKLSEEYANHDLTVRNANLFVNTWSGSWWTCGCCRRKPKRILKSMDISIRTGHIVALLGNSGSGKTSLLNVIANRHSGKLEGEVHLDGKKLTSELFRSKGGYVIQSDRLLTNLTVKETLSYTANLKLKGKVDKETIKHKIASCLRQMSLWHVRNTLVGGVLSRGISGGEKRRLTVAVQLLQDPWVLLLDEPTTGLDSFTAHYLVETLADLAHKDNKMVILTIHQPRSDIFNLLDTIGILAAGDMVYYGPRQELVPYFSGLGYPCPTYSNPLDFYVDVASIDRRSEAQETNSSNRVNALVKSYRDSPIFARIHKYLENKVLEDPKESSTIVKSERRSKNCCHNAARFFGTIGTICGRMLLNLWRDKTLFVVRFMTLPVFAPFLWVMLGHLGDDLSTIQDRIGLSYQIMAVSCTTGVLAAATFFPVVRNLYYRESMDGLYNSVQFLVAYYMHIIPFHVMSAIIFATWAHWALGMYPEFVRYVKHAMVDLFQMHLGELQALAIMGIIPDPSVGQAIGTLVVTISTLYASGLLKSFDEMNKVMSALTYINHFKYASEIMAANELVGFEFDCSEQAPNCTVPGDVILEELLPGAADNMTQNFGILASIVVIYWFLVALLFLAKGRRVLH